MQSGQLPGPERRAHERGACLIGLDFGTESARGVLLDAETGEQLAVRTHPYRHGVMTGALPSGAELPRGWALQDAADYLEAAADLLGGLGRGRTVLSVGLDFTASSPMPAAADGRPLSSLHPGAPHAYVKLWKHGAAQPWAEEISRRRGAHLRNFGGKVSGEWLLAKAAQLAAEAPSLWAATDRFIEAGDWLVWQLTGREARSLGFAAYKAQFDPATGYPPDVVDGLPGKLAIPLPIGSPAGALCEAWRARTGIEGPATVAVAVIDSHAVLPAVGGATPGALVGALGTSAVYLLLAGQYRPLPAGIEGVAKDGSIRNLWCYEAGQASFGDTLAWFTRAFPLADDPSECFRRYNAAAARLSPGASHLVALDWWSGNRVPHADSSLSGMLLGLTMSTTGADVYRALLEAICFGARSVLQLFEAGDFPIDRVVLTSGLAQSNPLLVQIMADVLGRTVEVPQLANATAVGAAIHGAVAAGLVAGYVEGGERYGARAVTRHVPVPANAAVYRTLHRQYAALAAAPGVRAAMHGLNEAAEAVQGEGDVRRRSA